MEKRCPRCRDTKDAKEFYKDKTRRNGLNIYCKVCESAEAHNKLPVLRKRNREAGWTRYAYRKQTLARYRHRHPERLSARSAVARALKKGIVTKGACERCGSREVHAHHHKGYARDYWLDVRWLCQKHHIEVEYGK